MGRPRARSLWLSDLFSRFALRDVLRRSDHPDNFPVVVQNNAATSVKRADLAVRTNDPMFEFKGLVLVQSLLDCGKHYTGAHLS